MRGPLLSGPLGRAATLKRVCQIARERPPVVVLSALWLGQALSAEVPVTVLVEPDKRPAATRAVRRARRKSGRLVVATATDELPLAVQGAGCILLEHVAEISERAQAAELLARLGPALRAGGVIVALDAVRNPPGEARLAGLFLAAALTGITQERPRDGALLTIGGPPPAAVIAARGPG